MSPPGVSSSEPGSVDRTDGAANYTVARNTAFLVVAQVLGMPLSMLTNAVMARRLGPGDFGFIYLAGTLVAFGFLLVEWGQSAALTALIAKDRAVASAALGTGLVWRLGSGVLTYGALVLVAHVLGYDAKFQVVLTLVALARVLGTICAACLDAARGFERSSPTAVSQVRYNILCACLVVPALYLDGGSYGALVGLVLADLINTTFVCFETRSLGIGRLRVERNMLRTLLKNGVSFMLLGLALNLQPNVDATMLSRLATPEAIGWYAAARKLVGLLIFPVTALTAALYPTLCRLHVEDKAAYLKLVSTSLRVATILVVPVALGTALFPRLGIMVFSEQAFAPAEDNLRILAAFVLLVYFTMVLGSSIQAAGRERAWTVTQFACVAVSAVVDPVLIPWFHQRTQNGGLGVCVSTVLSELLMLACGVFILPRGVFDSAFAAGIGRVVVGGCAMTAAALLTSSLSPFIGAPLGIIAYALTIAGLGGADEDTKRTIKAILLRRAGRV